MVGNVMLQSKVTAYLIEFESNLSGKFTYVKTNNSQDYVTSSFLKIRDASQGSLDVCFGDTNLKCHYYSNVNLTQSSTQATIGLLLKPSLIIFYVNDEILDFHELEESNRKTRPTGKRIRLTEPFSTGYMLILNAKDHEHLQRLSINFGTERSAGYSIIFTKEKSKQLYERRNETFTYNPVGEDTRMVILNQIDRILFIAMNRKFELMKKGRSTVTTLLEFEMPADDLESVSFYAISGRFCLLDLLDDLLAQVYLLIVIGSQPTITEVRRHNTTKLFVDSCTAVTAEDVSALFYLPEAESILEEHMLSRGVLLAHVSLRSCPRAKYKYALRQMLLYIYATRLDTMDNKVTIYAVEQACQTNGSNVQHDTDDCKLITQTCFVDFTLALLGQLIRLDGTEQRK
uniref:Uncharacterized protein n=1 Tax=Romanomermis culicivorax TaxID=13658 RepID=A0A915INH0_ROMCU